MKIAEGQPMPTPEFPDDEDRASEIWGSYDEGRRHSGTADEVLHKRSLAEIEADKVISLDEPTLSDAARRRRARAAIGPQYGEELRVGYTEGRPEDQPWQALSPEQIARYHHFTQHWKEEADRAIRNGTHAVDD